MHFYVNLKRSDFTSLNSSVRIIRAPRNLVGDAGSSAEDFWADKVFRFEEVVY